MEKENKKRTTLIRRVVICGAIVITLVVAYGFIKQANSQETVVEKPATLYVVAKGAVQKSMFLDGVVVPKRVETVYSDQTGKITSVKIEAGDIVKAGDELIEVDVVNTYGDMVSRTVEVPSSGTITGLLAYEGQNVANGQSPLVIVSDLASFDIECSVTEYDINDLTEEQAVLLGFEAIDAIEYEGKITKIFDYPLTGSQSTQYKFLIDATDYPEGTKAGMSVDIEIISEEKEDVIRVEDIYIFTDTDGHSFVKKIISGESGLSVEEVSVTIGLEGDKYVEIIEGLQEGDELILPTAEFESSEQLNNFAPMQGGEIRQMMQ